MKITELAIEQLRPSKEQPPDRAKDIASLVESIKAIGLRVPLLIRPEENGSHEIIAGHRRYAAAQEIGLKTLPCIITAGDVDEAQALRMVENMQRLNYTPMQEAAEIQRLVKKGFDFPKIAAELGMSAQYLARRAKLLDLSPEWVKALADPKQDYSKWSTQLLEIVARYPHPTQNDFMKHFDFDYPPDAEELKDFISKTEHELSLARWDLNDESLLPKAGSCAACPKRSGCQPLLFEELAEDKKVKSGDRCLDADCWDKKRQVYIKRSEAKFIKEHPKIQRVSAERDKWDLRGEKAGGSILAKGTYKEVKENADGAVAALPIDGPRAGELIWITKNRDGQITRTPKPSKSGGQKKPEISDKERKERLLNRRNMFIVQHLLDHVSKGKTEPLGLLRLRPEDQIRYALCMTVSIGYQFVHGHDREWSAFSLLVKKDAKEIIPVWWKIFKKEIYRSIVAYNGEGATKVVAQVEPLVEILGLDWLDIQKKAADEIPDRHGLLDGKKPEVASKPKGSKKTTAESPTGTPNKQGVFVEGCETLIVPKPTGTQKVSCRVMVIQAKDKTYRSAHQIDSPWSGGGSLPSMSGTPYQTRSLAIMGAVAGLMDHLENIVEVSDAEISKQIARKIIAAIPTWCEKIGITYDREAIRPRAAKAPKKSGSTKKLVKHMKPVTGKTDGK